MRYPQSKNTRTPNIVTDKFIGVSRKAIAPEGSFADCENVASDNYPGICTSAGYEDVSTEFLNIQAMVKPPEGENSFCGVADGKVYWKGEELIFAPKSNFTVQKDSKIVLYLLNKHLFIYEMRKSGLAVLYRYDTVNRSSREHNYIIVCYQRYELTAGCGLCLCLAPGNAFDNDVVENYPNYESNSEYVNQIAWCLVADKSYKHGKEFDIIENASEEAFSDIKGEGASSGETTKGQAIVLLGAGQNPDINGTMDDIMCYREDVNDIADKNNKAVKCYVIGTSIRGKYNASSLFYEYDGYIDEDDSGNTRVKDATFMSVKVMFYSDENMYGTYGGALSDSYGVACKRVNPNFTNKTFGDIHESSDFKPVPVGGMYLLNEILPQITFPCVYKNRMWAGKVKGDGIVATGWGSGWDFFSFDDISSDSIEIAVTSDGTFTGLKEYNDSLLCFKENRTIVIYGDTAYNFAIGKEIENIGCIDIRSCVAVDGVLYFLGKEGFYSYSGGWPQFISNELNTKYISCIAFTQDGKYYAEGTKANGEKELVVYDTRSGIWLLEKAQGITGLCAVGSDIYIAAADGIKKKRSSSDYMENDEEWFFESSDLYEGIFENKGILEITVRAKIKEDCTMTVSTIDSNGDAEERGVCYGTGKLRTYRVPVKLTKDEAYRYRISGDGPAMIYDIERKVSAGGRTIGE